jgi:hypothetical protein
MKKLSIFVPKLNHMLGVSLLPILPLHSKEIINVTFNDLSESKLMRE